MWAETSAQGESERLNISFEAHLSFLSYQNTTNKNSASSSSASAINLAAFDSLDEFQTKVKDSYKKAMEQSFLNRKRGAVLQGRVLAKLKDLGLTQSGVQLTWVESDEICKSGLVLELLLLPWAGLRDYRELLTSPRE